MFSLLYHFNLSQIQDNLQGYPICLDGGTPPHPICPTYQENLSVRFAHIFFLFYQIFNKDYTISSALIKTNATSWAKLGHTRSPFFPPRVLASGIRQYQAVSCNIGQYQGVSISIGNYQAVSGSISEYQAVSVSIRQYQVVYGSIRQYWTLSGRIMHNMAVI